MTAALLDRVVGKAFLCLYEEGGVEAVGSWFAGAVLEEGVTGGRQFRPCLHVRQWRASSAAERPSGKGPKPLDGHRVREGVTGQSEVHIAAAMS